MNSTIHCRGSSHSLQTIGLALAWLAVSSATFAASVDIANAPMSTSSPTAVKANVMFTLDDSGSMGGKYMPDEMNDTGKYGYRSSQCNGLAYNPAITYALPVDSTGATLAPGSLAAATALDTNAFSSTRGILSAAPTVGTGNFTVTTDGGISSSYSVGDTVMLYSDSNQSNWMLGTVTAWTSSSDTLSVNITTTSGSGTLASPRVGRGDARPYYYLYTGSEPKMGWTYTTSGVVTSTNFYQQCRSNVGSTPGSGVFTKKIVSSTSGPSGADERQNYANWLAYYRTRMDLMKAGVSIAFKSIGDKYRVGFNKISTTSVTGTNFLDIADFGTTQKANFYTKLNAASPGGYTPLRGAMSKVGQYFANKRSGQTVDPVQYSCQKNFHVLSTDGYWNVDDETSSYGPKRLDNTTNVGQQDGTAVRPMFDGAIATSTTIEIFNTTSTTVTTVVTPQTTVATATATTTTNTPFRGWRRFQYGASLRLTHNVTNSNITRCTSGAFSGGNCTITVTVPSSPAHGLLAGDTITISGSNVANYNGTWTILGGGNSPTTTTYKFTMTGLAVRPPAASASFGTTTYTSGTCPSGQGSLSRQEQRGDEYTVSNSATTTTTTTPSTRTTVTTAVTTTPYTHTTIVVNGVQTSDTTVPGTPTTISTPVTTVVSGTPVDAVNTVVTAGANTPPTYSNYGASTNVCVAAIPSPNPSTPVALGSPGSSTPIVTGPVNTTTGPTTTGTAGAPSIVGPTVVQGPSTTNTNTVVTGGSTDSLADAAMYYYKTDLRNAALGNCQGALGAGTDVCKDNVVSQGNDVASWQHMTTFTLGLGVNGILKYDPNYLTQVSGDFNDLKQGTKDWSIPGDGKGAENIDDLWHAAVNGRGQYFSATDPTTLASSLSGILLGIEAKIGSASAAAASNLQPIAGDNRLFVAQFTSVKWIGDVLALTIDPVTGVVSPTISWSASAQLKSMVAAGTSRNIYYFSSGATNNMKTFEYANLSSDGLNGYMDNACTKSPEMVLHCSSLSAADATAANTGSNLVKWLRGDYNAVYRLRESPLGDIVNGAPVYMGKPPFKYTENGYTSFVSANASRTGVVYVAANDGMLHAFDGSTGVEKWAFMPSGVLPNLYKLADNNYSVNHRYLLDGAPMIGDIWTGSAWKTILVGGFGAGGRSYYALDITNPNSPVALWEFTDTHMGLTFGNPIITKRADGTWMVVVSSGYNNNVSGGDGNGRLYFLNALTGALITSIQTNTASGTPAGTATTPSGLTKITGWVDSQIDNTAKRFYGGDLLGNIWRFDLDSVVAPNNAALRMAQLLAGTTPQPITTLPMLAELTQGGTKYPVVFVGTGKYLETADLSNTAQQTIYAVKDPMTNTQLGDVRGGSTLVKQTLTTTTNADGATIRTGTKNAVDWSSKNGWYVDLPSAGERVNVDPLLIFSSLSVAGNIPSSDACTIGGESFFYQFDISTGGSAINGSDTVGMWTGNTMIVGLSAVQLEKDGQQGKGDTKIICVDSAGNLCTKPTQDPPPLPGPTRRTSWREIVN